MEEGRKEERERKGGRKEGRKEGNITKGCMRDSTGSILDEEGGERGGGEGEKKSRKRKTGETGGGEGQKEEEEKEKKGERVEGGDISKIALIQINLRTKSKHESL